MKKIAVGDLGEFWYGDYKEPFEQLEGGVPGHPVGVVLKADDGRLLCAYCGKTYDNLGRHVSATHKMSAREYKSEVGLLQKSALVSEKGRQTRVATALRLHSIRAIPQPAKWEKGKPRSHQLGRKNPMWNPEALNKTGRCYEQSLAVARSIAKSGRRVTQKTMAQHGVGHITVTAYFGSYERLRELVGAKPRLHHKWSDEELVSAFRSLAQELGRTPRQSDLNRYGLPSVTFSRRFTHEELCQRAGVPPNLPVPMDGDREVQVLSAYSIIGDVTKVAEKLGMAHKTVAAVFSRYGCPYSGYGRSGSLRREWAADMARRLAGLPEEVAA